MAINEMIPLQTMVAPLGNALLTGMQQGQAMRQAYDEKPIRNELLQQQKQRGAQQQFNDEQKSLMFGSAELMPYIQKQDWAGAQQVLERRAAAAKTLGLPSQHSDEGLQMLKSGDYTGFANAVGGLYQAGLRSGVLQEPTTQQSQTGLIQIADRIGADLRTPEGRKQVSDFMMSTKAPTYSPWDRSAAAVDQYRQTQDIKIATEPTIAANTREATLGVESRMLPKIEAEKTRATEGAKAESSASDELARAQAALPGLRETVSSLKELSKLATYTTTGKVFDTAAKELGFGPTKGATARAKMISVVDNQVLPLLRDTFGAAFTAAEGERLRDTLLDPDATPEAKEAQLNAFMDQKVRDIETKQRQLGAKPAPAQQQGGYGNRPDGTAKGTGFLGELRLPDGGVATEYSVQSDAVKVNGQRVDFPTLVPTLSQQEVQMMVNDIIPNRKPIPEPIMQKAIQHAKQRIAQGQSPFANSGQQQGGADDWSDL